ncbi:MAG TPA: hypothetical protein PKD26_04330 [Pyrinomonadaceae bacterium]|nr:hypothetical protein [Pyrinomonadaceae bacterium]
MVVRAIALSIALLIGLGTLIPLSTDMVEAGPKKTKRYKKKQRGWTGVRKYSKRWWQLYRAQERRKNALAAQRRANRLRQIRLARMKNAEAEPRSTVAVKTAPPAAKPSEKAILPSGEAAPAGWNPSQTSSSELQFSVDGGNGTAAITVVGPAVGESIDTGRNQSVGGVPTSSLRREVINRMIRENGWVVNDYQKEIAGKPVYVVVAQSQGPGGRVNSRMFYFTEVNGRIYSVATNSQSGSAEKIAEESEKVIFSLQGRSRPVQAATR